MPLLSIIIPTRNRVDYLLPAIQSVLSIPGSEIELVVEDNSDSADAGIWIKKNFTDKRLVYNFSDSPVSMTENYERAVRHAAGEYVCFIGDDDGINPEIVEAARWAKANGLDALVPLNSAHYVWPDLNLPSGSIKAGELKIGSFSGCVTYLDAGKEMVKCARSAGQDFFGLPRVYYGIIRRSCLDQVEARTGSFFPGVSPDMSGAMAVANYVHKVCQIDYPLFLPGSSANSNAGISGMRKHVGRLKDQKHLSESSIKNWSKIVPAFYSVETIWAEAAVSALEAIGRSDILREFNVPMLYAELTMWHPRFLPKLAQSFFSALRITQRGPFLGTGQFIRHFFSIGVLRAKYLLKRFKKTAPLVSPQFVPGLLNIDEAVRTLSAYLLKSEKCFGRVVRM